MTQLKVASQWGHMPWAGQLSDMRVSPVGQTYSAKQTVIDPLGFARRAQLPREHTATLTAERLALVVMRWLPRCEQDSRQQRGSKTRLTGSQENQNAHHRKPKEGMLSSPHAQSKITPPPRAALPSSVTHHLSRIIKHHPATMSKLGFRISQTSFFNLCALNWMQLICIELYNPNLDPHP